MDIFFKKERCDRCHKLLDGGRIMSMLNTDCICLDCAKKEKEDPRYEKAREAEYNEVKKGNYNYPGLYN